MEVYQECFHPLCRKKFKVCASGKRQRFHIPACRRDWDKIKARIGKKVLKCVLDEIMPMLIDELRRKNGGDRRGEAGGG